MSRPDELHAARWTLTLVAPDHQLQRSLQRSNVPLVVPNLTVPATVLSALSHVLPHPFLRDNCLHQLYHLLERVAVRFHTRFVLPQASEAASDATRFALRLDAVLFAADVVLNGRVLLSVQNAFRPYCVLLPPLVAEQHEHNTLCVQFASVEQQLAERAHTHSYREWNDPKGGVSRLRVPQYLAGWDWAPRQLSQGIVQPVSIFPLSLPLLCDMACVQTFQYQETAACVQLNFTAQLLVDDHCAPLCVRCVVLPRELDALLCDDAFVRAPKQLPLPYCALLNGDRSVLTCLGERARLVQVCELQLHTSSTPMENTADETPASSEPSEPFMYNPFSQLQLPTAHTCRYSADVDVVQPRLWWPNGMGEQNLYQVHAAVFTRASHPDAASEHVPSVLHESRSFTIGLRHLQLIRDPSAPGEGALRCEDDNPMIHSRAHHTEQHDEYESLMFSVNGRSFFAKGANYIPSRMQYHLTTEQEYERTISSACNANMNMLRVWGGGLYEKDVFYELCNERGILLWHDFMFSCSLYPGDDPFLDSCREEARYQVSRLRNHPCMALWCGNNELEQVPHDIVATDDSKLAYDTLFYNILPRVVEDDAGQLPYWPSSPHNPLGYEKGFNNPRAGDSHFWDVWHARKPVTSYLNHRSRFCSEFGMQSYLSEDGARACVGEDPGALNPFGPMMEAHQKNASGNLIIMEYCQRLFRAPKDYTSLSYQSQLNQMFCMQTGVEHFRRSWPYCAGALYWQLNDCWPCFSWSSLEFGGNWKALHFGAKRFFAPLLISAVHHGEQNVGVCNLISFTDDTGLFSIHGTFDGPDSEVSVKLSCGLFNICTNQTEEVLKRTYCLKRDTSRKLATVDVRERIAGNPRNYVLRLVARSECGRYESCASVWLCSPRLCNLNPPKLTVAHQALRVKEGKSKALLEISCDTFAPFVEIKLKQPRLAVQATTDEADKNNNYVAPVKYQASDNYFDLFPGEVKQIELIVHQETSNELVFPHLSVQSLVESYMA